SNTTSFALQPRGDATTVTWSMTGRNTLMTRVIGIFKSMDAMVGPDFERGLAKLKSLVEARS
ncbi:MAG: SRPBCC family protein, partial [Acidimicrobiia bacterium]|nr:SRPBCC family protein [Acidimicrobiia bacterium]